MRFVAAARLRVEKAHRAGRSQADKRFGAGALGRCIAIAPDSGTSLAIAAQIAARLV